MLTTPHTAALQKGTRTSLTLGALLQALHAGAAVASPSWQQVVHDLPTCTCNLGAVQQAAYAGLAHESGSRHHSSAGSQGLSAAPAADSGSPAQWPCAAASSGATPLSSNRPTCLPGVLVLHPVTTSCW